MRAFWLVPTHYLLEDRRIADVIINIFFFLLLYFLKQINSMSGESVIEVVKISVVLSAAPCVTFFSYHILTNLSQQLNTFSKYSSIINYT